MTRTRSTLIAAAVGAALLGGSLGASAAGAALPAERHQGSIAFVTGGVGKDEAAAFEQAQGHYPLMLEFVAKTKPREEFLAGVKVTIKDAQGMDVLNTTAAGPFLLAKLPAGEYKVFASHADKMHERTVMIGKTDHRRLLFEWQA